MVYKSIIFPFWILGALVFLNFYLGRAPLSALVYFAVFLSMPLLFFSWPFRIVLRENEIEGPDANRLYGRTVISIKNTRFYMDEKAWGAKRFRIRDEKTGHEIGSYYIYFSRASIEHLRKSVLK